MSKGGRLRQARRRSPSGPGTVLVDRYLTAGDVLETVPDQEYVTGVLAQVPVERALDWVARMLAPSALAPTWRPHQQHLARKWFTPTPAGRAARDLVLSGQRQLLAPHLLLHLARLAVVHGSRSPAGDHEPPETLASYEQILPMAMLVLAHHSGAHRRQQRPAVHSPQGISDPGERVLGEPGVSTLELELAANVLANHKAHPASVFDRSARRWLEIPTEEAGSRAAVDLAAEYQAATGVPLQDLRMIAVTLWARAIASDGPRAGSRHLDGLGLGPERTARALGLLGANVETLAAEAADLDADAEYESSLFQRRPVVLLDSGGLLVISPSLLIERALGWLPRWDLAHGLTQQGREGRKRAERAVGYLRRTTERHTTQTLAHLASTGASPATVYEEASIQRAYGTEERNADCALDWPGCWVVAEVSSRTVTRGTAAGLGAEDLLVDLDHGVITKAEQLHATIAALRADETLLTGAPRPRGDRRFRPVLVTTEGFPVNPLTSRRIESMLRDTGYLQEADTAPLVVLDVEALEAAETVAEQGGPSLPDLLARHETSPLRGYGFRQWLLLTHGPLGPPARIMSRWDRVFEPVLAALETEEDHDEGLPL